MTAASNGDGSGVVTGTLLPPRAQPLLYLLGRQFALASLEFEQERQGLPDRTAGGKVEEFHDRLTVELRAFGLLLGLTCQPDDSPFEFVDQLVELRFLGPVAGGAIGPDELVEQSKEVPGISGVTPNRRVAPALAVPLEASREADELGDVLDDPGVVTKLTQASLGNLGANGFVVSERDTTMFERAGVGLADVVEQRSEPECEIGTCLGGHRDRVGEHIFVAVDRVLFEFEGGQLGNHEVGITRRMEFPEGLGRIGFQQHSVQTMAPVFGSHRFRTIRRSAVWLLLFLDEGQNGHGPAAADGDRCVARLVDTHLDIDLLDGFIFGADHEAIARIGKPQCNIAL